MSDHSKFHLIIGPPLATVAWSLMACLTGHSRGAGPFFIGAKPMKRIKAILDDHGIKWKMQDGKLLVLDCYMKNGKYSQEWIVGPQNEKALLGWLGY